MGERVAVNRAIRLAKSRWVWEWDWKAMLLLPNHKKQHMPLPGTCLKPQHVPGPKAWLCSEVDSCRGGMHLALHLLVSAASLVDCIALLPYSALQFSLVAPWALFSPPLPPLPMLQMSGFFSQTSLGLFSYLRIIRNILWDYFSPIKLFYFP